MVHKILQNSDEQRIDNISRDPALYYALVDIVKLVTPTEVDKLKSVIAHINTQRDATASLSADLIKVAQQFHEEQIHTTKKRKNSMGAMENPSDEGEEYDFRQHNYIVLLANTVNGLAQAYSSFHSFAKSLVPPKLITAKNRIDGDPDNFDQMNGLFQELQFNSHAVQNYANTLVRLLNSYEVPSGVAKDLLKDIETFYKYLLTIHGRDGVKIIKNPVVTNVAMHIFENIDSHGEIKKDNKSQISAYTMRKAETLAQALTNQTVREFLNDPDKMHYLLRVAITDFASIVKDLINIFSEVETPLENVVSGIRPAWMGRETLSMPLLNRIDSMKFSTIVYQESVNTNDNRLASDMRDETIAKIADMITSDDINFAEIVEYVIDRKVELNKFFFEENSFYVCKIGEGNPFLGQAPGALYVEPAERPMGRLKDILGSGFEEIRNFSDSIESAAKFHDLFVATSPSKSADKSNVLMVGPMGCGKTEVLRAVGADRGSIGVFAQGSDFLTCWKGEAEKNPKRLFQEGLRLSRESDRHVHFLIDEIDSLLNNDRDLSGNNNLTLEFQILMDGVVRYPNLSVWGETNHVHRIPMPMIRRFNKVLIVGELDRSDRATLLQRFTSYMPITGKVKDADWENWATRLEGATGDVIRKVSDHIWRTKMTQFVAERPDRAEEMVRLLNENGKFSVDKFNKEKRDVFKRELAKFVVVSGADIDESINANLLNMGIRSEIETAISTYKAAREYLEAAKQGMLQAADCQL